MTIPQTIPPLFITGASGFVGRRVLDALVRAVARDVRLLVRDPERLAKTFTMLASWRCVNGSLDDIATLTESLRGVDTVLHLASSSGKVPRSVHEHAIVRGTERLLSAAELAGVRRFLYVSSVAAGFTDRAHYHYAGAKRAAEALVLASSMDVLVVRPTMIFGEGSPVLDGMQKLAMLPLPIVFGTGASLVQPIDVEDVAALLVAALHADVPWHGETLTVGGADAVSTEELLRRLRGSSAQLNTRFMHVPIEPLRSLLAMVEPMLLSALPFTAGQLTSFTNASDVGAKNDAASSALLTTLLSRMTTPLRGLDAMLAPRTRK